MEIGASHSYHFVTDRRLNLGAVSCSRIIARAAGCVSKNARMKAILLLPKSAAREIVNHVVAEGRMRDSQLVFVLVAIFLLVSSRP